VPLLEKLSHAVGINSVPGNKLLGSIAGAVIGDAQLFGWQVLVSEALDELPRHLWALVRRYAHADLRLINHDASRLRARWRRRRR
jgi:hypothetical protein